MLLVNGSTVYLRDMGTSEWLESIDLDSLVINLYHTKAGRILCITENSIKTLALPQNEEKMREDEAA